MKGRCVQYSAKELAFIESHRALSRRALHEVFVARFGRHDVTLDHLKSLCTRRGWLTGRERWTPDEDALLRTLYPDLSTEEVARRLGRTVCGVYGHANTLGLAKSAVYLASPAACRLRRGDNVGAAFRFEKGHAPANKGLRRPGWATGRMKETQFTKGQAGHNWKPIGSERLVDGYRYTKIADVRRVPWTVNWKPTHILQWEALHGPMPADTVLKCLGDRLNTDPSNWDLIPRAMLPRLNGKYGRDYDSAPSELKPIIMAAAKLQHAAVARRRA